mmetsp:Transcript_2477/g.6192  ORF Transcript_2477/g.6192 Transcript_2477/m.6192 type:complete len:506 (+) Transcript_2477:90-1607(+)
MDSLGQRPMSETAARGIKFTESVDARPLEEVRRKSLELSTGKSAGYLKRSQTDMDFAPGKAMAPTKSMPAKAQAILDMEDLTQLLAEKNSQSESRSMQRLRSRRLASRAHTLHSVKTETQSLGTSSSHARRGSASSEAKEPELEEGEPHFTDDTPLQKALRLLFNWMAAEPGARRIASKDFKARLPEVYRRLPDIATSFRRMDSNSDGWLEWEEFRAFFLEDSRILQQMRRSNAMSVFGKEKTGAVVYKEVLNPARMCEMGQPPALLPWEVAHVVEWRITGLSVGAQRNAPVKYGSEVIRPGMYIASPPFNAAGASGFLRFWPMGFWTEAQRRSKLAIPHRKIDKLTQGTFESPPTEAWCCLGACFPEGTRLVLKYFVEDDSSEERDCVWHSGTHYGQVWSPPVSVAPKLEQGDSLVVGLEITQNVTQPHGKGGSKYVPLVSDHIVRHSRRPLIKEPRQTVLKSQSLPKMPKVSYRQMDTMIQEHRILQSLQHAQRSSGAANGAG